MTWRDRLRYDDDTILILEIAEKFLHDYFNHDESRAEQIIDEFFARADSTLDEKFVRHEHSWGIATRAHYLVHVGGQPGEFFEWRRRNDYQKTPRDALDYLRTHYWNREGT